MMHLKKNWLKFLFYFFLPILLLCGLIIGFLRFGPLGVLGGNFPPIEKIFVKNVLFKPDQITLEVFNDGPETVSIAQLIINDVYWRFQMEPDNVLRPLEEGELKIFYPWIEGNPLNFMLVASDGVTFEKTVDVAFNTPIFNENYIKTFIVLGVYVGLIPVLLGLLWFPILRKLRGPGYTFLLSLTVGLLVFLGFDAFAEAIELFDEVPGAFNAVGILVIGFLLAILILGVVTHKTEIAREVKSEEFKSLTWAYLIALGIGIHNMGEGLAIGSAYAIGEIALGASLVIGFMVHNLTEGIAIISPLTRTEMSRSKVFAHMICLGLIAGAPTIIGSLIGGFAYSPTVAVLFLAIGAGAIFDVSFDILNYMAKGRIKSLFTSGNVLGFFLGLMIMYGTGFLVLG